MGIQHVTLSALQRLVEKINARIDVKVDKVEGKQLSTEDYTTAEKAKLADLNPGTDAPQPLGIESAGQQIEYARADHVHQLPDIITGENNVTLVNLITSSPLSVYQFTPTGWPVNSVTFYRQLNIILCTINTGTTVPPGTTGSALIPVGYRPVALIRNVYGVDNGGKPCFIEFRANGQIQAGLQNNSLPANATFTWITTDEHPDTIV